MGVRTRIRFCKIIQLVTDFMFFCIGSAAILIEINSHRWKDINDPRLTLFEGCLENDSAGFIKIIATWGGALGVAMTINATLGVYSCVRKKLGLQYYYSMLGYMLTLMELLYFFTVYNHLGRVTVSTKTCLRDVLVRYYSGPFKSDIFDFAGAWDFLHRRHRCCGIDGGKIFNSMVNWDRNWTEKYDDQFFHTSLRLEEFRVITVVPYTCCRFKNDGTQHVDYKPYATIEEVIPGMVDENCPTKPTEKNSYIHIGCFDLLHNFVLEMASFSFSLSLVAESLQLVAAFCALYISTATYNKRMHDRMKREGLIQR